MKAAWVAPGQLKAPNGQIVQAWVPKGADGKPSAKGPNDETIVITSEGKPAVMGADGQLEPLTKEQQVLLLLRLPNHLHIFLLMNTTIELQYHAF